MDTVLEEPILIDKINKPNNLTMAKIPSEVRIFLPSDLHDSQPNSRRMTGDNQTLELALSRRPSFVAAALRRPSAAFIAQKRLMMEFFQGSGSGMGSKQSLRSVPGSPGNSYLAQEQRLKNRRIGDDSLTTALSALYAKLLVVLGIAFPVTDILSNDAPPSFYQGFYLYLYIGSFSFVAFMVISNWRQRAEFSILYKYRSKDKNSPLYIKKRGPRYGSFYLRVGAIAFGIGSMVYSGLEFGQYFELKKNASCHNVFIALNPAARMILTIVQMQFIFLNTKDFEMGNRKVIARFGLMHMIATNLCEWLYVLVEETKHEIVHIEHKLGIFHSVAQNSSIPHQITKRATAQEIVVECRRTNIMGSLVQNASPFLFPCTIEYSLICAVILFEMWKKVRSLTEIQRSRRSSKRNIALEKNPHNLSVDCSKAHRGMFGGILITVLTIISLIMYFVLHERDDYGPTARLELTITETIIYVITAFAVIGAMLRMRDLKYSRKYGDDVGIGLDCMLLLLAQSGVYIYSMFSIIGSYFTILKGGQDSHGNTYGIVSEVFSLAQTSIQTIFILNSWWRRCKGAQQNRIKPGREFITFLLVANMAMWFINTLIKSRASFRETHLIFFGQWAWTIITHVSMPLAIFYRFHSTICLFEIWKTAYKIKHGHE